MEGGVAAHRVVAVVSASGELEAGDGGIHGGLPRPADPSTAAAVARRLVRGTGRHPGKPVLHADARRGDGRHDPRERHPHRRGPAEHRAAGRSGRRHGRVARHAQRRDRRLAPGPRLRHARPQRPGSSRHHRRDRVLLPALFPAAHVQQRLLVPDPSARPRGDTVRDLVADPFSAGPCPGKAHAATADGAGRPALATHPRTRLLQPAATAEGAALQGIRVHAAVEPDRRTDLELRTRRRRLPRRLTPRHAGAGDPEDEHHHRRARRRPRTQRERHAGGPVTGGWDTSVDLLIAGSGGGGMVAALAALDSGLEPLIVEKQPLVGGSTGLSGGIVWIPNNPLMRAEGIADSHEDGLAYLADVVGDIGAPSSPARREVFLTAGYEMINFLIRKGVRLIRCAGWSDYYPNHKGGNESGRAIEGIPFDAAELGSWSDKVQPPLAKNYGFVVLTNELRSVQYYNRSPRAFAVATRVFLRTAAARIRRRQILTNGASLIAQMLKALVALGGDLGGQPPLWTNAALEDLIVEDGRVVGARVSRGGAALNVEARRGVLLSAGGFGHNKEMRRQYSGDQPNEAQWSIANAGDTGEVLQAAMRLGAKTDLLDEAWWLPSVFIANGGSAAASLGSGRQRPGAIYVDSTGRRFCNESNSYVEVGKAMYANKAVPCWMIFDDGYVRRYVTSKNPLKRKQHLPSELIESGAVKRGDTIADVGRQIELPADELARTIERFNRFAAKGLDPDFGRGQSAYNDCLGDPGYRPNAAVGPLHRAPFYATRVLPADVGTCGGVITNEYAQVLDEQDQVIDGLYATGNTTATVMGRTYPGAGASIASSMVFGYVAARHAAGRRLAGERSR